MTQDKLGVCFNRKKARMREEGTDKQTDELETDTHTEIHVDGQRTPRRTHKRIGGRTEMTDEFCVCIR